MYVCMYVRTYVRMYYVYMYVCIVDKYSFDIYRICMLEILIFILTMRQYLYH